jgi:predicted AAA+ superfamily ATPase
LYERNLYTRKIEPFIDKPVIKVITGMRRVGKSSLLLLLQKQLLDRGIPERNILFINKESLTYEHVQTHSDLNDEVKRIFSGVKGKKYLFLDEVQMISQWERAAASFLADGVADLFIAGSNASLLSSELATLLSGRYVEFPLYPLSFPEYLRFRKQREPTDEEFSRYLRYGGFPGIHHIVLQDQVVYQYINSLFNTILLKDVIQRNNVRNIALLEQITRFVFDNIGNIFSAKKVADFLKSQRKHVGVDTVYNYISYLEAGFLLHRVPRYDVRGKRHLEVHEKYFIGDIGLRHAYLGYREGDISGILENVVFLALKQRGYRVSVGKVQDREVDFISERENHKEYIQVAYLLADTRTIEREFTPLQNIEDNYPKTVLSMDREWGTDVQGIRRKSIIDFLMEEEP